MAGSGTDLAKYELKYSNLYRESLPTRIAHPKPEISEFKQFLDIFGAAVSSFTIHTQGLTVRPIATAGSKLAGMIINRSEYYVPSLVPDNRPPVIMDYFTLLADALTATHNKLHVEIPKWAAAFQFSEEPELAEERRVHAARIAEIDSRTSALAVHKAALFQSGEELAVTASAILEIILGAKVEIAKDFREDVKVTLGAKIIAIGEIKGINRGVARENINQADSHRERSGHDAAFPAFLIANTAIKSARNLSEKDQAIADEQVQHAVKLRILILRTIDLLGLIRLVLAGQLEVPKARELFVSNIGWLRVVGDTIEILPKQR